MIWCPPRIAAAKMKMLQRLPYGLCGTMNALSGCVQGLGDTKTPLKISLLTSYGLRIIWVCTIANLKNFRMGQKLAEHRQIISSAGVILIAKCLVHNSEACEPVNNLFYLFPIITYRGLRGTSPNPFLLHRYLQPLGSHLTLCQLW